MEQEYSQIVYNLQFSDFLKHVELTDELMSLLKSHPCSYMLHDIKKLENKGEMKVRIFSVFANERDNCDKLADILDKSKQKIAADKLRKFNKTETLMEYVNDIELSVAVSISKRSDTTHTFKMDSNPRGKALIIVNIPELMNEAKRFEFILTKLLFDVQPICALKSSKEIDKVLDDLANETHDGDAFFLMFIGHGYQDKIRGYGGDSAKVNDYKRMFIIYSCAKGSLTLLRLEQDLETDKVNVPEIQIPDYKKDLYFNPGIYNSTSEN
ncbi:unnamed protein product [Oppiella nova]|uniref:Caspase family p20 domain-containing protein n=1 Tax=Oppiella nova TaxID=334625 RepID=A0A7R9M2X7_9ACAR|nr:unnamed protein product [Oppiella nova]CAG2169752.1 unnamed protein product [Oppiella nova]